MYIDAVSLWTGTVIEVDDVFAAHALWSGRGVSFTQTPSVQFYGGWAKFVDSEDNELGLHSPGAAQ